MPPTADTGRVISWYDDPGFQDWLNQLMANAGDEWDTDEAMTAIAIRYVRQLEALAHNDSFEAEP